MKKNKKKKKFRTESAGVCIQGWVIGGDAVKKFVEALDVYGDWQLLARLDQWGRPMFVLKNKSFEGCENHGQRT